MTLDGRIAFVTGGTRGIGEAIVRRLHAAGAKVYFTGRDSDRLSAIEKELGETSAARAADMTSPEQIEAAVKDCVEHFGGLDILINNAGITRDGLLMRMKEEDWDTVLDTNLKGAFLTCKAAARKLMGSPAGRIVNITSVIGLTGNAGQINYAASKAGLIGLTKSLAKEMASRGVTANAVAPGFIETDMTAGLKEDLQEQIRSEVPLRRYGRAEEVAALASFLAGDDAAYITGQVFTIDGGLTL